MSDELDYIKENSGITVKSGETIAINKNKKLIFSVGPDKDHALVLVEKNHDGKIEFRPLVLSKGDQIAIKNGEEILFISLTDDKKLWVHNARLNAIDIDDEKTFVM